MRTITTTDELSRKYHGALNIVRNTANELRIARKLVTWDGNKYMKPMKK